MIFELMEAHLHGLAGICQYCRRNVPFATSGLLLQRLRFRNYFLIPASSPEAFIVIRTARFIRFVGLHLRFAEVLLWVLDGAFIVYGKQKAKLTSVDQSRKLLGSGIVETTFKSLGTKPREDGAGA